MLLGGPLRWSPHNGGTIRNKNFRQDLNSLKKQSSPAGAAFRSRPPRPLLARCLSGTGSCCTLEGITHTHTRNRARACVIFYCCLLLTCCSRNSRQCWNVEKHYFLTHHRKKSAQKNVKRFVEKLLNCWECSKLHKTFCASLCGKPVENVENSHSE